MGHRVLPSLFLILLAVCSILLVALCEDADRTSSSPHELSRHIISSSGTVAGLRYGRKPAQGVLPKVALMFLVQRSVANEAVWRVFLETADAYQLTQLPPPSAVQSALEVRPLHLKPALPRYAEETYVGYQEQHKEMPPFLPSPLPVETKRSALEAAVVQHTRGLLSTSTLPTPQTSSWGRTQAALDSAKGSQAMPEAAAPVPARSVGCMLASNVCTAVDTASVVAQLQATRSVPGEPPLEPDMLQALVNNAVAAITSGGILSCWTSALICHVHPGWLEAQVMQVAHKQLLQMSQRGFRQELALADIGFSSRRVLRRGVRGDTLAMREPARRLPGSHMFSLYVHCLPGHRFPEGSIFHGREVPNPANTTNGYAQWSLIQAEIKMMQVALLDPLNVKFALIADSSIPLYPPYVIWSQLMWETRSRVDACKKEMNWRDAARWSPEMNTDYLQFDDFRKSWQWVVLTRTHSTLAVTDRHVSELFHRHCYSNASHVRKEIIPTRRHLLSSVVGGSLISAISPNATSNTTSNNTNLHRCVADEHFMPTLLASYGFEHQTDCSGQAHCIKWGRSWHPTEFSPWKMMTKGSKLRDQMRGYGNVNCSGWAFDTIASAKQLFRADASRPRCSRWLTVRLGKHAVLCGLPVPENVRNPARNASTWDRNDEFTKNCQVPMTVPVGAAVDGYAPNAALALWLEHQGYRPLGYQYPLFARKFAIAAANATLRYATDCDKLGIVC